MGKQESEYQLKSGNYLISEPFLEDESFSRSVVLLCDYSKEDGAFGLILNKRATILLKDVVEIDKPFPIFVGGPVEHNTLHFIHVHGTKIEGSIDLGDGIYWGGDFEQISYMINDGLIKSTEIRFFLGYSGWAPGQLEEEMKENSWIVTNANSEEIFKLEDNAFWPSILKRMGGKYKLLANYPIDPRLN